VAFSRACWRAQACRTDASHNSIAQKVAGSAFLIRVVSAALVFGSQILFARWMGSFEFGIYVYVWAWVLVIGEFADLGLASAAQRFIPEYSNAKSIALLRGFIAGSRWLTVAAASAIAICGALAHQAARAAAGGLCRAAAYGRLRNAAVLRADADAGRHRALVQLGAARADADVRDPPRRHAGDGGRSLCVRPADRRGDRGRCAGLFAGGDTIGQTVVLNRRIASEIGHGSKANDTRTWFAVLLPMLMVGGF
jgi:hypothetical protein